MPERTVFHHGYAAAAHEILAELREQCPVTATTTPAGRPVWLLTRDQDVRRAFLDRRLVLPQRRTPGQRAVETTLMNVDAASHARLRGLAAPSLTPQRVEAWRPAVEDIAAELVEGMTGMAGMAGRSTVDLMAAFARPFPFRVLCTVFGVPPALHEDLQGWMSWLFDRAGRPPVEAGFDADRFEEFLRAAVRARRDDPGADLVSDLAAGISTGAATEDEVVSLCAMLLLAGFDSTIQMIGFATLGLLITPGLLARVRSRPELIGDAVEELLRWDTPGPFSTPRRATVDLRFDGQVVPAGSEVLLGIAAANRDPRRYAGPDDIDVGRSTTGHLAFGLGPHYCLGAALARLELSVALTALVRGFPGMRLPVAVDELVWQGTHGFRRLAALPVTLTA
jgi:cytochrome P450